MREKPWTAEDLSYQGGRDFGYPNFGKSIPPGELTKEEIESIPKEPSIDGNTGVLNFARDFVVDGLGSIVKGVTEGKDARRDRRYVPKDVWLKETKRLAKEKEAKQQVEVPKEVAKPKVEVTEPNVKESKSAPLDLKSLATNSLPYPVKTTLESAIEAFKSGKKVVEQGEPVNAVQDAGRGVMRGLADTTGSVLDLGGIIKNRLADEAHKSANWWKDQYEIADSEAGNIGTKLGTEAVAGVAGGVAGKGIGSFYQKMKQGGETLKKRATNVAKDREAMALGKGISPLESAITRQKAYENMTNVPPRHSYAKALFGDAQPVAGSVRIDPIPYGHPMSKENLLTKVLREQNHMNGKDLDGGYSTYDVLNPVAGKMEYPTASRLTDAIGHNTKRKLSSRAMLKRNDAELETMFNQGTPLDTALQVSKDRWNRLPRQGAQTGTVLGSRSRSMVTG